jgi:hypothetical protein
LAFIVEKYADKAGYKLKKLEEERHVEKDETDNEVII